MRVVLGDEEPLRVTEALTDEVPLNVCDCEPDWDCVTLCDAERDWLGELLPDSLRDPDTDEVCVKDGVMEDDPVSEDVPDEEAVVLCDDVEENVSVTLGDIDSELVELGVPALLPDALGEEDDVPVLVPVCETDLD